MVAAMAIGGTVAFLQDDESKMNVMTVGDAVDIVINEYQRGDDGLEEFEPGKELYPIVGSAQADATSSNMDKYGMPTAENYGDKIVTIENTGGADAYVRVFVAKPLALSDLAKDGDENTSDDALHMNFGNRVNLDGEYTDAVGDAWKDNWGWDYNVNVFEATIDGEKYEVCTFYTKNTLKPTEESTAVIAGVYLDATVDYDDGVYTMGDYVIDYDLSKGVTIPVYAQASSTAFDTSDTDAAAAFAAWADTVSTTATPDSGAVRPAGYAPATEGEVIDNLVVMDGSDAETNLRALYKNGLTGDITITNSYLDGTYAMNLTAVETANAKLTAENTAFRGWVSFSGFESASFTNCTFDWNSENTYNYFRAYDVTVLTNCELSGTTLDVTTTEGGVQKLVGDITLVNCTYNGQPITAEMLPDIVAEWDFAGVSTSVRIG